MKKINSITIVTSQGVKAFFNEENQEIVEAKYVVDGDPFDCFNVVEKDTGKIKTTIRCVHNLDIEYDHSN